MERTANYGDPSVVEEIRGCLESLLKDGCILSREKATDFIEIGRAKVKEEVKPKKNKDITIEPKPLKKKEEVKPKNDDTVIIIEPTKIIESSNEEVEIIDVEPTKVEPLKKKEDNDVITMNDRRTCPVKVIPKKDKISININKKKEVDKALNGFLIDLNSRGVLVNSAKRVSTGLVEIQLIQATGNIVTISVDIDNKIYNSGYIVFFIGKVKPLDEYINRAIILTDNTLNAIINNIQIDPKYYVPEEMLYLNKKIDMTTLKENNKNKREKVLEKVSKTFETLNEDIIKAANGEPTRFAFAKYESPDKFSIVSSKRNLISNLDKKKLNTSKEIWINVNKKNVTLNCKTK